MRRSSSNKITERVIVSLPHTVKDALLRIVTFHISGGCKCYKCCRNTPNESCDVTTVHYNR